MAALPVIYLAAGRGSRLGELCSDRPKALIDVNDRSLADRAFDYLRAAGVSKIIAVTGHAAACFADFDVETRFNDRWKDENNIVSLWQVRDIVATGCLILNCDLLFEPALAKRLIGATGTKILVDDVLSVDDESMKVTIDGERLVRLHKSVPIGDAVGEYLGMTRVDPTDGPRLAEILNEFVAAGNVDVYYEDAIAALAAERVVGIERVGGLRWVEIDDHDDLRRARQEIGPAIEACMEVTA